MEKKNSIKKPLLWLLALVVAIAAVFLVYRAFKPQPTAGEKAVVVEVIHKDGTTKTIDIQTDAEYLRQALEEHQLISGSETEFGLFVDTVDGEQVDANNQEWWAFTKSNEMLNTGVDTTPVTDGDHYEITFTIGY